MRIKMLSKYIVGILIMAFPGASYANDSCTGVEREMAYGEAALEDAKDNAGFKLAAEEFNKAVQKAPYCASAFFNLGLVQEKAGELAAAKAAYEKYLKLTPNAPDAAAVKKQVFKLTYRIQKAERLTAQKPDSPWAKLNGKWCSKVNVHFNQCPDSTVVVRNNTVEIHTPGFCHISTITSSGRIQGDLLRDGERPCSERAGEKKGTFGGQVSSSGSEIKIQLIMTDGFRMSGDIVRWD